MSANPMPRESCRIRVGAHSQTAFVSVEGRGTHVQALPLKKFLTEALSRGHHRLTVDLAGCVSMDSTFLGVLAAAALRLKEGGLGSAMVLHASPRNLEAMKTLGIDRLLQVVQLPHDAMATPELTPLPASAQSREEWALTILEAHEFLASVDAVNRPRIDEVVQMLQGDLRDQRNRS